MSQGFPKFSIYNHNNTKRDKNDPVVFDMEMDGQFYLIHKTQSLVKDITGICTIIALLPRVRQTFAKKNHYCSVSTLMVMPSLTEAE